MARHPPARGPFDPLLNARAAELRKTLVQHLVEAFSGVDGFRRQTHSCGVSGLAVRASCQPAGFTAPGASTSCFWVSSGATLLRS